MPFGLNLAKLTVALASIVVLSSCRDQPCARLQDVAQCGPHTDALPVPPAPSAAAVAYRIYIDRSGSMTGYLDTAFAGEFGVRRGSSSLRRQLEMVLAAPNASSSVVYGFGERVVPVGAGSGQAVIGELVRQDFYRDNNTRLEDVLDSVAADTRRTAVHLIITDGRRATGEAEIGQYARMAQVARQWLSDTSVARGGVFAAAVVSAPFHQVRSDRAGCWAVRPDGDEEHESEHGQGDADRAERASPMRCPLYTFAFIPRRGAGPVLEMLRQNANRLFVTPTVPTALALEAPPAQTPNATLNTVNGPPLHLFFTSDQLDYVHDTVAVIGSVREGAARYAIDDSLIVRVQVAQIDTGFGGAWSDVPDLAGALVKPGELRRDTARKRLVVPLELRARKDGSKMRLRLELVTSGRPGWLGDYEATKQGEGVRTYGLSALFDQLPEAPKLLGRFYVSIY